MKRSIKILTLLFLMVACCLFTGKSHAQGAKSIFFEVGGPGLASFNYDTRFTGEEDGIGGRIGVGGFSVDGSGALFIPVGINYLMGKDQRRYFEIGAGATVVSTNDNGDNDVNDDDPFTGTFGHLHFGYRMQPLDGGFTFRAGVTPIFGEWGFIPYYFSLSFGYKF